MSVKSDTGGRNCLENIIISFLSHYNYLQTNNFDEVEIIVSIVTYRVLVTL